MKELELLNQVGGVRIRVELDALRRLLDLQVQEILHALTAGEVKILGIQSLIRSNSFLSF